MDRKEFATACPKLEEVVRLVPDGVGARVTLGECYVGLGKLASAWASYNAAETTANRLGQGPRAEKARVAAEALKPRLATLTIQVSDQVKALPGVAVQRDGVAVGPAVWGVAIPVDNGRHVVTASANGKQAYSKSADVAFDGVKAVVTIDALADAAPGSGPGPMMPAPEALPLGAATGAGKTRTNPLVYVGFITAGVGIGVGTVTGIMTLSTGLKCKTACTASDKSTGEATGWVSNIGFGVGVAGAGLGVFGLLNPKRADAASALDLRIGVDGVRFGGVL